MAEKRWFYGAPTDGGMFGKRYRMRDRVFGWGPIDVIARGHMIYLDNDNESPGVGVSLLSPWIEFKEAE